MNPFTLAKRYLCVGAALLAAVAALHAADAPRTRINFDDGWQFQLAGSLMAEAAARSAEGKWQSVTLPHDWSIEGGFEKSNPTGGRGGYFPGGIGWYRKEFSVPAEAAAKRIIIEFDGIYKDAAIWVNGRHVAKQKHGYVSTWYDLTDLVRRDGRNIITVRVDCSDLPHDRWYSGAGIYRHVWLTYTSDVRVPVWGAYITTPQVSAEQAQVDVEVSVENRRDRVVEGRVVTTLVSEDGRTVASLAPQAFRIGAAGTVKVKASAKIERPSLWDIDSPRLYRARHEVFVGDALVDLTTTRFGIRSIDYSLEHGFRLNGRKVFMKGGDLHHDGGSVGAAVPEWTWYTRLKTLKEIGCNTVRLAHNPHAPEVLALCDELGLLVVDEAFDKWEVTTFTTPDGKWDIPLPSFGFKEHWEAYLRSFVLRDRNHPSIVLWSVGNEVVEVDQPLGAEIMKRLAAVVRDLEPTRPVTAAIQPPGQLPDGRPFEMAHAMDVVSYNYMSQYFAEHREKYGFIILGSETLPYYTRDIRKERATGEEGLYSPGNSFFDAEKYAIGHLIWSAIDYLGEAVQSWPQKGWENSLVDTAGFRRTYSYYIQSLYSPEQPMVHIAVRDKSVTRVAGSKGWDWPPVASHWNWDGASEPLELYTYTTSETVELLLNGRSLGTKRTADFPEKMIAWSVPFEKGKLEAVGRTGGKEVARHAVVTAGAPARIVVHADRSAMSAAARDAVHVVARVYDREGNLVPDNRTKIRFAIKGPAKVIGVDNGDLWSLEPYKGNEREVREGRALAIVQATGSGAVEITAEASGLTPSTAKVQINP